MSRKILLLGARGKLGRALYQVFGEDHEMHCPDRSQCDAADLAQVARAIVKLKPDIVINTVALMGIDACEVDPRLAFQLNAMLPRKLAQLSLDHEFMLVHFSSDAVFSDRDRPYLESDGPMPLNVYGITKAAGDLMIEAIAERYYIGRVSVLFGETRSNDQFVEKMLRRIDASTTGGHHQVLRVADDLICSPCYSRDVANAIRAIIETGANPGLYHLANSGKASLYQLINEIVTALGMGTEIERASYKDFPGIGRKNVSTPLASEKVGALRPWQDAVREYCKEIRPRT